MSPGNTAKEVRSRTVILAGAFPPPVHGCANAMLATHNILQSHGYRTVKLATSKGANRSALVALPLVILGMFEGIARILVNAPRRPVFYLGISGGIRQLIDIILLCFVRLSLVPCVVHHHSFAYLKSESRLTRLCLFLAGVNAIHVVLCECMARDLFDRYRVSGSIVVISNAALMSTCSRKKEKTPSSEIVVGFLGAITTAKGTDDFLAVAEEVGPTGVARFVIAGSQPEAALIERIRTVSATTDYLTYLGPIYGEQKESFLSSLDVLLFPTKYVNEAEPLVVLEALAHSVVIITNSRGCLSELKSTEYVVVAPEASQFRTIAADSLKAWSADPTELCRLAEHASSGFNLLRDRSSAALDALLSSIAKL
jgi:glycosyltransferase involved in cell wall biosynthesis